MSATGPRPAKAPHGLVRPARVTIGSGQACEGDDWFWHSKTLASMAAFQNKDDVRSLAQCLKHEDVDGRRVAFDCIGYKYRISLENDETNKLWSEGYVLHDCEVKEYWKIADLMRIDPCPPER